MKNRFETLRAREVPEALDRRIMAAAGAKGRGHPGSGVRWSAAS